MRREVHHASAGMQIRPLTRRPQGGHAPRTTDSSPPLLLLLALAPAASAHDESDPNHRDTPADLAGADIDHTLALAHLSRHGRSRPARSTCPRRGAAPPTATDDTAHAAFPARVRQIKVVYAHAHDQPDDFGAGSDALQTNVSRIEQFLALQTGGRRALRFDMGTRVRPAVRRHPGRPPALRPQRLRLAATTRQLLRRGRRRRRRRRHRRGPRDVFILADGLTADDPIPSTTTASTASGASPRSRPTTRPAAATTPTRAA